MNEQQLIDAYTREGLHQYRAQPADQGNMPDTGKPVDLYALIPYLVAFFAWGMWLFFLLMPTAFSFDYAGMFPAASNWAYVGMGLTLCLAASVAAWFQHGVHAIAFTFAMLILSYWIF